ncbi:helix-turn-helix domain-containing protein [Litoribacillus peritrichatus]|uniref:Helix-turn-helix domain-containing protein n=1 Tax=Litoribacillus peritrichatus TaxID=718191 RepID=A0ABP7M4R1_9GAMM
MSELDIEKHVNCGIEQALKIFGDRWSLLVIRNVLMGINRFDSLQDGLDISRNILTRRLNDLEEEGLLVKTPIKKGAKRMMYNPTAKCLALVPVLIAMIDWSKNWSLDKEKKWSSVVDRSTNEEVHIAIVDENQQPVPMSNLKLRF